MMPMPIRTTYRSSWLYQLAAVALVCGITTNSSGQDAAAKPDPAAELRQAQQQVFRAALEAVQPSIVRIDTIGGAVPVDNTGLMKAAEVVAPGFRLASGPTTGVICSADGYIVSSSFNFLRDPTVTTVTLADGRRLVARLVARDNVTGLVLLKVNATDLPVPRWLPREELRAGQWVLVAGQGHGGQTPVLSVGALSAVRRLYGLSVQVDAKTSPLNYGGPLFDVEGRVIGICVPRTGTEAESIAGARWYDSGIGFGIPADYLHRRLPTLQAGKDIERGLLGVEFETDLAVVGEDAPAPDHPAGGLLIAVPPGPATEAGLQVGDVITRVNDRRTTGILEVLRALATIAAGESVDITYQREGVQATVSVTLGSVDELRRAIMPEEGETAEDESTPP
ncbi:MAG: trypsin-like peptidase domain-containing protein [Planctomycetota bacterium]